MGPGLTILALHRTIPFYAQARFLGIPLAPYDDIITYARLNGVEALLLKEGESERSPEMAEFADQLARDPRWQQVEKRSFQDGRKTETYRLYRFSTEATRRRAG